MPSSIYRNWYAVTGILPLCQQQGVYMFTTPFSPKKELWKKQEILLGYIIRSL